MLILKHKWFVFFGGLLACASIFVTPDLTILFATIGGLVAGIGFDLNLAYFNQDKQ